MEQRYCDSSDEELIKLLRNGDEEIYDFLCSKYKGLVRSRAQSMYMWGAEAEDLIQEGMIGLFKGIMTPCAPDRLAVRIIAPRL